MVVFRKNKKNVINSEPLEPELVTIMKPIGSVIPTELGSSTFIAVPAPTSGGIPVVTITTASSTADKEKAKPLPPLPSHRYRYTLWHDLRSNDIKGDQLRHPRVRKGPSVKDKVFYDVKDEQGHSIHHNLKGTQRKDFQRKTENWEIAQKVNLSYQDLGHDYQVDTFLSILKRLSAADEIQLMDNNLHDLRTLNFPKCISLNLSQNFVASFNVHINVINNSNVDDVSAMSFIIWIMGRA